MTYEPDQRVTLVHTNGPETGLRPGDTGTVAQYHPDMTLVETNGADGTQSQLRPGDGDRLGPASDPTAPVGGSATAHRHGWAQVLTAGAQARLNHQPVGAILDLSMVGCVDRPRRPGTATGRHLTVPSNAVHGRPASLP